MFADAVKKGNPDAIVAMNNGLNDVLVKQHPSEDFTAGEYEDFVYIPDRRFFNGAQAHILAPLGVSPFDRFGAEFAMMIPWVASQAYPELFSYDIEKEVKYFYQTFSGYTLTDDEVSYIVNGLKPDGTPEIENAK
jgi:hypothetical protein